MKVEWIRIDENSKFKIWSKYEDYLDWISYYRIPIIKEFKKGFQYEYYNSNWVKSTVNIISSIEEINSLLLSGNIRVIKDMTLVSMKVNKETCSQGAGIFILPYWHYLVTFNKYKYGNIEFIDIIKDTPNGKKRLFDSIAFINSIYDEENNESYSNLESKI